MAVAVMATPVMTAGVIENAGYGVIAQIGGAVLSLPLIVAVLILAYELNDYIQSRGGCNE